MNRWMKIPAAELRTGDLLHLGLSGNYVLIADAQITGNRIDLTVYNGTTPADRPTLRYKLDEKVELSMRDAKP